MMDMHLCPDKLLAALDVLVDHNIYYGMATAEGRVRHSPSSCRCIGGKLSLPNS